MLERLSDYARDDKSTATGRAVGIIETLFDAADEVIKADEAPSSLLSIDDQTRVYFVVRNLLKRTPAAERVAVLTRVVQSGRALGFIVRQLSQFGADFGRYGRKPVQPEDRLLLETELDELEQLVKGRLVVAASDGSLWKVPHILVTLSLWRRIGDEGRVDCWLKTETADDVRLVRLLEQSLGWKVSQGMSDWVARRRPRVTLTSVEVVFGLAQRDGIVPTLPGT
jgi:predicted KAP-like P-loop ATPase